MPIEVKCPKCEARFAVAEKFAGREGPCPKCKAIIPVPQLGAAQPSETASSGRKAAAPSVGGTTRMPAPPGAGATTRMPTPASSSTASAAGATTRMPAPPASAAAKGSASAAARAGSAGAGSTAAGKPAGGKAAPPPITDEIKIHGPEEYAGGGKDKKGRPLGKPKSRVDAKFSVTQSVGAVLGVVGVFGFAWLLGQIFKGSPMLGAAVGGLNFLVAIPLALTGYWILSDPELEGYTGTELWGRVAACAAVYALMWVARAYIPPDWTADGWNWIMLAVPFLLVGMGTAFFLLDMENENAFFHFFLFLGVSILIRGAAGLPWI